MANKPWKYNPMARTCQWCGSQRPGMQPLTIRGSDGNLKRGYWHLECFEKEKAHDRAAANAHAQGYLYSDQH